MHFGLGQMIEKKNIPSYKGTPSGTGPFERTACGVYVLPNKATISKSEVLCNLCTRTRTFRLAGLVGPWVRCETDDGVVWQRLASQGGHWLVSIRTDGHGSWQWEVRTPPWKASQRIGNASSERLAKEKADAKLGQLSKHTSFKNWLGQHYL